MRKRYISIYTFVKNATQQSWTASSHPSKVPSVKHHHCENVYNDCQSKWIVVLDFLKKYLVYFRCSELFYPKNKLQDDSSHWEWKTNDSCTSKNYVVNDP